MADQISRLIASAHFSAKKAAHSPDAYLKKINGLYLALTATVLMFALSMFSSGACEQASFTEAHWSGMYTYFRKAFTY